MPKLLSRKRTAPVMSTNTRLEERHDQEESVGDSKTSQLYDKHTAVTFYEGRYAQDYMDDWPVTKRQRVFALVHSLKLPPGGEAIDFGCGTGVFTEVIRQALPFGWRVYGSDISHIAIGKARKRYPQCVFFVEGDPKFAEKRFNFLFTHHVLEHVSDLSGVIDEIARHVKSKSVMLHILPCGNDGSFERGVCILRKDGINSQLGNRFFFEDEGHVRRLTTEELSERCRGRGFILTTEYYSNQYYGAIDWMTEGHPRFVRLLTDGSSAVDEDAARKLKLLRVKLSVLCCLRYPAICFDSKLMKSGKTNRDYVLLALGLPFYPLAKLTDWLLKRKAADEWKTKKTERTGSEMYLCFRRGDI